MATRPARNDIKVGDTIRFKFSESAFVHSAGLRAVALPRAGEVLAILPRSNGRRSYDIKDAVSGHIHRLPESELL